MKNKILLGSVTLLCTLMAAACGNGEKKTTETTATPTTETTTAVATTTAPTTTGATSETIKVSLADTQRVGREGAGYVNIPNDWVEFKDKKGTDLLQYSAKDKSNVISLYGFTKDQVKLNDGDTFNADLIATRIYYTWKDHKDTDKIEVSKETIAGAEGYLVQVLFKNGTYYFRWVVQKGDIVYTIGVEGAKEGMGKLILMVEQSWGLDPNTPGK